MIARSDDSLQVSGNLTIATATALFKEGLKLKGKNEASKELTVDFAKLEKIDSSAVSLMLSWLREAQRSNVQLKFANVPDNVVSLAKLYGVADLLSLT